MPKTALLRLAISGLLLLACLINHAVARLPVPRLRLVPIERLPRQINSWTCTRDLPIEDKVRVVLPDAAFLSREYRDASGRTVQVFLQTSQDAQMFHSPTQCMPAQNWNILNTRRVDIHPQATITGTAALTSPGTADPGGASLTAEQTFRVGAGEAAGASATEMEMQDAGQNMLLLYWYTSERQLDKWESLKSKLLSGRPPTRLFVRILVPSSSDFSPSAQTARDFARALLPAVTQLEKQG